MDAEIKKIIQEQEEKERAKKALIGTQVYVSAFLIAVVYIFFNPDQMSDYMLNYGVWGEIVDYIVTIATMTIAFIIPMAAASFITEKYLEKKDKKEQKKFMLTVVIVIMVIFFFIKDYFA